MHKQYPGIPLASVWEDNVNRAADNINKTL